MSADQVPQPEYNIIGPQSPHVKLISSDDTAFFIKREEAIQSSVMASMLTGPGAPSEDAESVIYLTQHKPAVVQVVCDYLRHRYENRDTKLNAPQFNVPQELTMDVLMAANFLDC